MTSKNKILSKIENFFSHFILNLNKLFFFLVLTKKYQLFDFLKLLSKSYKLYLNNKTYRALILNDNFVFNSIFQINFKNFKEENVTTLQFSSFFFSNSFSAKKNSNSLNQESNENLNIGERKSQNRKNLRLTEPSKQQVVSITYEEIGLFPRSFNRVFDRFFKQLFFDVENLVIQEYRFYRYLFLTTVKCLFILIFVPLSINFIAKHYLVYPITEYYWNTRQSEIFLNSYQQKRAYTQLHDFEEKIYFESLIFPVSSSDNIMKKVDLDISPKKIFLPEINKETNFQTQPLVTDFQNQNEIEPGLFSFHSNESGDKNFSKPESSQFSFSKILIDSSKLQQNALKTDLNNSQIELQHQESLTTAFNQLIQNRLQEKTMELAIHYNEESIEAITNFFADVMSFGTLCFLLFNLEIQINITKSFLLEVFFGLDDSKKSLLILFLTDLLVGYHSPNIWELFFQSLFDHYGLPESETTIFLLVATLPVLLDVLFKYLIFRHLNRASPATVATYHAMIE